MARSFSSRSPVLLVLLLSLTASAARGVDRTAEFQVGYGQGPGFMVSTTLSGFAKGFPLDARFGFAYNSIDPGDPSAARRIFINDGNNGTPQESGRAWDLRLDLLWSIELFENQETYLFAGPRYSRFNGSFRFVGGNEEFDVKCRQWGVGAGLEGRYPLLDKKRTSLVVSAGLDYYIESGLSGHDTTYNPSGSDVNPRRNFDYGDADAAIEQPKLVPRIMVGVRHAFGG